MNREADSAGAPFGASADRFGASRGAPADWHREDPAFRRIVRRVDGRARAEERIRWLGFGYLAVNSLGMLGAAITFLAIAPWGWVSGDPTATWVLGGIGAAISGFIAALSLPGFIAGWGLLQRKTWARSLALVLSMLSLFAVPFGTILGALGIYVLLQEDVREVFEGQAVH